MLFSTLRSREEVVKFIEEQLSHDYECKLEKNDAVHYGYQELRLLLDYIYREGPQKESEKLLQNYAVKTDLIK